MPTTEAQTQAQMLLAAMTLIPYSPSLSTADSRPPAAGLPGLLADLLVAEILLGGGVGVTLAQLAGFCAGAILTAVLSTRRFRAEELQDGIVRHGVWGIRLVIVSLLALILRGAVLALTADIWHWPPSAAILIPIALTAAVNAMGVSLLALPRTLPDETISARRGQLVVALVAYVVILRLVFAGLVDLLPEEAYYWNYARHLDISYLDHPPLVAWLIWLSTSLFGKSEFAVRLPAFVSWVIAAYFMFRLATNLFDQATAVRSALLLAVLPIYFATGLIMTPDAPLYAAWAGCLFFLERALLAHRRAAWWGIGVCLGLGLLAKYTIALLGLAALAFVLIDRRSRRWLLRPEPYLAALLAIVIFSPVLIWNAEHEWASFVFQGPRRWSGGVRFSLHVLFGTALVLLTPLGLAAAIGVFLPGRRREPDTGTESNGRANRRLFMLVFTLVPLLVFAVNSLRSVPMLNWTGPIWLAVLPFVAWHMLPQTGASGGRLVQLGRRLALPAVAGFLLFYGASLHYIYAGLPGIGSVSGMPLPVAWEELGNQVEAIEQRVQTETAAEPVVVGMDRYWISSEVSFYAGPGHGAREGTGGRYLFGGKSVMWDAWLPPAVATGRNMVLVDFGRAGLMNSALASHFSRLSEIFTEDITRNGRVVGHFHWRVGYGYLE